MLGAGLPARVALRVRRRARPALIAVPLIWGLVTASPADAAPPPKPSDAQIAATAKQRKADIAALGTLAGQIAAIDGDIARTQAAVDLAVTKYNATVVAVQIAVADVVAQNKLVSIAREAADKSRGDAILAVRANFINGLRNPGAALVTSDDPSAVLATLDVQRYITLRKTTAVENLARLRVTASNAEADARASEERERRLQAEAVTQRDAVIGALRVISARKVEKLAKRKMLNEQAAITYGRLRGLLNQRAAYQAWEKEQARLRAAELRRQAALARERARLQRTQADQGDPDPQPSIVLAPAAGGTWGNPMAAGSYSISSCFCARWGTFHYGVDFAASLGVSIYSVGAGTVVAAGPAQGFGNWVVIDHGTGEYSVYGHMRLLAVSVGQHVSRGQLVAWVGSEGESTGPHLHFEIRLGGIEGTKIDPQVWLAQRGVYV